MTFYLVKIKNPSGEIKTLGLYEHELEAFEPWIEDVQEVIDSGEFN